MEKHIIKKIVYPKSPLRYPGGKARAVPIILSLIPKGINVLISPFIGGASIEIAIASMGVKVIGFDIFKPLVVFWNYLLDDPERLANEVQKYLPLPKEKFYELQKTKLSDDLKSAAIFYTLNRSSFSGSTLSGGMSPDHPRFTTSSINYLRNFECPNLIVKFDDFKNTLAKYQTEFMYLDPPYMITFCIIRKQGGYS